MPRKIKKTILSRINSRVSRMDRLYDKRREVDAEIKAVKAEIVALLPDSDKAVLPDGRTVRILEVSAGGHSIQPYTYSTLSVVKAPKNAPA